MADEYNRLAMYSMPVGDVVNHLAPQLPAGHPSNMLRSLRDMIPQVQADDTSTMSGIYSRLGRTATALPRGALETMANWLEGTHNPQAVRIGEDTIAPLGLFPMGMALTPKNAVGVFGGRLAQTADHNALATAEKMAAAGAPRETIWKDTGWFQGPDGKWRFEIDDSQAVYMGGVGRGDRFDKYLDHPKLAEAYPAVATEKARPLTKSEEAHAYAGYDPDKREFVLKKGIADEAQSRSSTLHEAQHFIQEREGFSPGSNMDVANEAAYRQVPQYRAAEKALADAENSRPGGINMLNPFAWMKWDDRVADAWSAQQDALRAHRPTTAKVLDAYRRSAGEVEARAVQARRDLTPEQRAARPPWLDYDTPVSSQILADNARSSVPGTVVNAMGEQPQTIRAYHGTDAKFDRFDPAFTDEVGFHFGSKEQAEARLRDKAAEEGRRRLPWPLSRERTIPVDIEAKKILDLKEDPNSFGGDLLSLRLLLDEHMPRSKYDEVQGMVKAGRDADATAAVRQWLTDEGYDVVRYPNKVEGAGAQPSYMTMGTGNVRDARTGKVLFSDTSSPGLAANATQGDSDSGVTDILRRYGLLD